MELGLRDGRVLEFVVAGGGSGPAVLFLHGTPGAAMVYGPWIRAVLERGWRWVATTRAGYGGSAPRPGRSVADDVDDVTAVLDALEVERFVAVGWSGGGPHALACGARMAGRCVGVVSLGGVAPYDVASAAGLDWRGGMTPGNVAEYGLALDGEAALRAALTSWHDDVKDMSGEQIADLIGGVGDAPADITAQTGDFADTIAASFREGVRVGIDGWLDDDLAFVRSWGFALADVAVPAAVWQGENDVMVPIAHARLLIEQLPDVRPHLLKNDGHLAIALRRFGEALAEADSFLSGN